MRIPLFECWKCAVGVSLVALLGCSGERQLPPSPAGDVLSNPPSEVTIEHIDEWIAQADGVDIRNGVTVQAGSTVELTLDASLSAELKRNNPQTAGFIEVRMLPTGASDSEWNTYEFSMKWIMGINENTHRTSVKIDAEPGAYDARVYLIGFDPYEDLPLMDLLAKTTVTVVE